MHSAAFESTVIGFIYIRECLNGDGYIKVKVTIEVVISREFYLWEKNIFQIIVMQLSNYNYLTDGVRVPPYESSCIIMNFYSN